jgi:hypothetical protein
MRVFPGLGLPSASFYLPPIFLYRFVCSNNPPSRVSEQGTIIGISGQDTPQGIPDIAVVIQFWFEEENVIPELVIMKKEAFMKFFLVQED